MTFLSSMLTSQTFFNKLSIEGALGTSREDTFISKDLIDDVSIAPSFTQYTS